MSKTSLIIAREYLTRVRKKSFLVMTILGPILLAALIIVPVVVAKNSQKTAKVMVVDDNDFFINSFTDTEKTKFFYQSGDIDQIKTSALANGEYDAVLHILKGNYFLQSTLYFYKDPPMGLRSGIESQMDKLMFDKAVKDSFDIDPKKFDALKKATRSSITMIQTDNEGNEKKNFTELNRLIGMIFGFAIYIFIFLFASQVLQGVLEEKTSRIVEVLLSTIKPVELMMGKIVGVAMVGLTQFALWVVLTLAIVFGVQITNPDFFSPEQFSNVAMTEQMGGDYMLQSAQDIQAMADQNEMKEMLEAFYNISFTQIIFSFLFYFLFGYLVYAALYAAIGSVVDNETDSNQFTLPVTIPLLMTIILVMPIAEDPHGTLAWWFSMIPLTSPVAMLIRLPSGVPLWELLMSMGILVLFFLLCVWMAAKIYRTGILLYGKKVTYKELAKWLKY